MSCKLELAPAIRDSNSDLKDMAELPFFVRLYLFSGVTRPVLVAGLVEQHCARTRSLPLAVLSAPGPGGGQYRER